MNIPETDGAVGEITVLLQRWDSQNSADRQHLLSLIQPELKRLAEGRMRRERSDHTLQPTALVNELYLYLASRSNIQYSNRAHFLAIASEAMRRLLVDYARSRQAQKRGGDMEVVSLDFRDPGHSPRVLDCLVLDELLDQLAVKDPRMAKVVQLRYFGGLTVAEVAEVLGVGERMVKRDWEVARAWLFGHLQKGNAHAAGFLGESQGDLRSST